MEKLRKNGGSSKSTPASIKPEAALSDGKPHIAKSAATNEAAIEAAIKTFPEDYRTVLKERLGDRYMAAMGHNDPPPAPERLRAIESFFKAHDKRAEDKVKEEFPAWFQRFAVAATEKGSGARLAWDEVKSKCDVLLLMYDLYLFTYLGKAALGKTSPDIIQDAFRLLTNELDKEASAVFCEPMQLFNTAKLELKGLRAYAAKMGSYKTEAHDYYLYSMAKMLDAATGDYHLEELASLIEAAKVAHGCKHDILSVGTLKRRIYRYIKRMNLPPLRPPRPTKKKPI